MNNNILEILLFELNGLLYGVDSDSVYSIDRISNLVGKAPINQKKTEIEKNDIAFHYFDIYLSFYGMDKKFFRNDFNSTDYLILFKDYFFFNVDRILKILPVEIRDFDRRFFVSRDYRKIVSGFFMVGYEMGIVLDTKYFVNLMK